MSSESMRSWENKRLDAIQREGPSPEVFEHWRSPRFGIHNPDNLTNAFWTFAIRYGGSGHGLNKDFDGPDSFDSGPGFSFQRYGQIELTLPDGRWVHIGGAHEDFYDPDFYIYNDVVVIDGDESCIINKSSYEVTALRREEGNFMLDVWVPPASVSRKLGFPRQL